MSVIKNGKIIRRDITISNAKYIFRNSIFTKNKTLLNFASIGGILATLAFLLYPAVGLNRVYMNKGIVIKHNASQSYTTDGLSSAIFSKICKKVNVPVQHFTNRADLRGGGTLGNISTSQVSIMSVDIGLAQLAMHSCYETAGSKDVNYMIDAIKEFYNTIITLDENGNITLK